MQGVQPRHTAIRALKYYVLILLNISSSIQLCLGFASSSKTFCNEVPHSMHVSTVEAIRFGYLGHLHAFATTAM
jgi:hypothetical protein